MTPSISSVEQLVNENAISDFMSASEILLKFANNILLNPANEKYRRVRLGNPIVASKLLPVSGAMECLFEMGFVEDGEYLTLPMSTSLHAVSAIKAQLEKERSVTQSTTSKSSSKSGTDSQHNASSQNVGASSGAIGGNQPVSADMLRKEREFYSRLISQMEKALTYENPRLQQKAREVMPILELQETAKTKLEAIQSSNTDYNNDNTSAELDFQDCLVLAMLEWFKNRFFKWVDAPACHSCGGKTNYQGSLPPTNEELRWGGHRVENYRCSTCQTFTKFVRYDSAEKLLETREGRCGEWANCFTLCCRAMSLEARVVLDWTDHVWTEVYSNSQQRWVHCDSCENACDKPLLYDVGWGKKLTYIIAFSVDDVEDVTWRYTTNFEDVRRRRTECREDWLVRTLYNLDKQKWSTMPETKRKIRLKRKIVDLVEFMTPKSADGQNLSGRISGSIAWRSARGEMGQPSTNTVQPYVFKLTDNEKKEKALHIRYSCTRDEYIRVSNGNTRTNRYDSCVNTAVNVFRKEENDWKMVYIARKEGTDTAEMSWTFDFQDLKIDQLEVKFDYATYENGKINVTICGQETCTILKGGPALQKVTEVVGENGFTLTATLSGGKGDIAWQHTQLFRQSMDDKILNPFEIIVKFK